MPLEAYSPEDAVPPYGLHNTGAICHMNSLLQAFVGSTAFVRRVIASRDFLGHTKTGRALHDYVWYARDTTKKMVTLPFDEGEDLSDQSAKVLAVLIEDLRMRRPAFQFGAGQQSASEGLVLLLDMTDVPGHANPVTDLFLIRYRAAIACPKCQAKSESVPDTHIQIQLFGQTVSTAEEFEHRLLGYCQPLEDWRCEKCNTMTHRGAERQYCLRLVSEVVVVIFNLYTARGDPHFFPPRFSIPGKAPGLRINYRQVSQIEHSGSLAGGHYWATSLRAVPGQAVAPHVLNDSSTHPGRLGPTQGVYMVLYQVDV